MKTNIPTTTSKCSPTIQNCLSWRFSHKSALSILCLFFCVIGDLATQPIRLHQVPDSIVSLNSYTQIHVDKNSSLSLEEVRQLASTTAFELLKEHKVVPKFEGGRYQYWYKFSIENTNPKDSLIAFLSIRPKDTLYIYKFQNERLIQTITSNHTNGVDVAPDYDYLLLNSFLPISIPPLSQQDYWVKCRSRMSATDLYVRLYPSAYVPHRSFQSRARFYIWSGIFLGVLLFVSVYNLLQYIQNKDKAFLYYALYAFSSAFYFFRRILVSDWFLKTLEIPWLTGYEMQAPFSFAVYIFYILFVYHFLKDDLTKPWFRPTMRIAVIIILSYVLVHQFIIRWDVHLGWRMNYYFRIAMIPFFFYILFRMWQTQTKLSRIIVGGSTLLLFVVLGSMFASLLTKSLGFQDIDLSDISLQLGTTLELLIFSWGLSYRTKLISDKNQQMELALLKENTEKQELAKLDAFKSRFYTNLTHEFRTPLTVIKSAAELLEGRLRYKQDEQQLLDIQRNGEQILALINQMLELSKLESGKQHITWVQADILLFLKYITDSFQSLAHQKKIMLSFYSSKESLHMDFDREKMQHIFGNLISNALKFTPEYGQIQLSAEPTSDARLQIKIKDTGKGIAAENLPYIFDRFYQVQDGTHEGTGIGLALVKQLTELLDGQIEVSSELGKGTSFKLYFPIHNSAPMETLELQLPKFVPARTLMNTPLKEGKKPQLLLIDDNRDILQYLSRILASKYQIESATNGAIGIQKAIENRPHLILCDVMMPEKDGFEVCATLKNDPRTRHIPIVLLTARASQEDLIQGLSVQANAYLKKPFDQTELHLTIENLLNSDAISQSPFQEEASPFLGTFKATVKENLNYEHLNIDFLRKKLHLSRNALNEKIKTATGMTTMQYVRHLRLRYAYYLLQTRDYNVQEVQFECGFPSAAAFSQAFKQEFGQSPSDVKRGTNHA